MSDNHLGDARDVEGDRPPRNDCGPALHGGQNTPAWSVHPVRTVSSSGLRPTDEEWTAMEAAVAKARDNAYRQNLVEEAIRGLVTTGTGVYHDKEKS